MAIIYSYPTATPELQDLLVGTEMAEQGGEGTPRTRTFTVGSIISLAESAAAGIYATIASVNLKANIASPTFTGTVTTANDAMINNVEIGRGGGNIDGNTAVGASSLASNTTGYSNSAFGQSALYANTTGNNNTSTGIQSLNSNTTGNGNTSNGVNSLNSNISGNNNTAIGAGALQNTTGSNNTSVGMSSLLNNTTGSQNTAIGWEAGKDNVSYSNITCLGYQSQPSDDNQVVIGNSAVTSTILRGAVTADSFAITEGLSTQYLMADGSTFTGGGAYAFPTLQQVTTTGPITTNNIEANSFIKSGGSSTQFLMANGNTSTMPTLQQVTTSNPNTTVGITVTTNANLAVPIKGVANWDGEGSLDNVAVLGEVSSDSAGIGVKGISFSGAGVQGESYETNGVSGISIVGTGVKGEGGTGVLGVGYYGIHGQSTEPTGIGVYGEAETGAGVYGQSNVSNGVYGISYSESANIAGVYGEGVSFGVSGYSINGTGIKGNGVYGVEGRGITFGVYGIGDEDAGGYFYSYNGALALISNGPAGKPGGGTWSTYSDSRIKQNITPYAKGLAEILLVNTVNFEYNGLANTKAGIGYVGIIAQDMKEVFPETIGTYKAKLNKEDEEETELYMFDANALTFALINAVKQLNAEIELLKSK